MPITQAHHTICTVAVQIVPANTMGQHVCIHNHEHSSNSEIFIGNQNVTIGNGIHAAATTTSQLTIGPGDDLWAISDVEDVELHVLVVKQN